MQASSYRVWLEQRGLAQSSADTYVSEAKRVERHYGDLDELYAKDRLAGVLQELRYSAEDARTNTPNPSKIPIPCAFMLFGRELSRKLANSLAPTRIYAIMLAIVSGRQDMSKSGPGRADREGLSIVDLFKMFPDDATAEAWFEEQRWPDEQRCCPDCGSINYAIIANRKPMPYRCRDCREHFSVRKGTVMQSSKLGLQKWVIAIYLTATGIKGTSSMKIHRDLGIRQSTAWHLMQRIRQGFLDGAGLPMPGPIEVDETFMGGKERNKHESKKLNAGRGAVGKAAVAGAKDRATGRVSATVVAATDKATLQASLRPTRPLGRACLPTKPQPTADYPSRTKRSNTASASMFATKRTRTGLNPSGRSSSAATTARTTR